VRRLAAAAGALLAVSVKLSMLPLALAALSPLIAPRGRARWRIPIAGIALALLGHAVYNVARFGKSARDRLRSAGHPRPRTPRRSWSVSTVWIFSSGNGHRDVVRAGSVAGARRLARE
jgi:hypothetical protein